MSDTETPSRTAILGQLEMVAIDITPPGGDSVLCGPYRRAEAQRIAAGARAAGARADIRELQRNPEQPDLLPILFGQWPQRGFSANEVASSYTDAADRWIVSMIVGYGDPTQPGDVARAADAAAAAIDWYTDNGDVAVFVYDRDTGITTVHERRESDAQPA